MLSVRTIIAEEVDMFEKRTILTLPGILILCVYLMGDIGFAMCVSRDDSVA